MFVKKTAPAAKQRRRFAASKRAGLALREFLVVGVILFFLLLMVAPVLVRLRAQSRLDACQRNLQNTARAVLEFEELEGRFPGYREHQLADDPESRKIGWVFAISPFLRTNPTADRYSPGPWSTIRDRYGPGGEPEARGSEPNTSIPMLMCPGWMQGQGASPTISSFVANGGLPDADVVADDGLPDWPENAVFLDDTFPNGPQTSVPYIQQRDGADMTLMLSENTAAGEWSKGIEEEVAFHWDNALRDDPNRKVLPINREYQTQRHSLRHARPSSFHVGGANAAFAGGGARFLSEGIDEKVYVALMTPDSRNLKTPGTGEPLGPPFGTEADADKAETGDGEAAPE